ncbi:TWiK family of potassium channels protein 7, partial [Stegodyphus mimosarum]
MTLDATVKKNKKKQKLPKKTKSNKASPGKCRRCCGKFATFLFSHVGLCALVIGYSIMGAFAFRALEAPYEEQKASQVSHLRQETVRRLWEITDKLNVLYKDNWTGLVEAEVRRFQKDLILAVKEGYDGKEGPGQQWSFSGAFLYSLTVITTI